MLGMLKVNLGSLAWPGLLMQQAQGLPCAEARLLLMLLQHEADPAAQRGGRTRDGCFCRGCLLRCVGPRTAVLLLLPSQGFAAEGGGWL